MDEEQIRALLARKEPLTLHDLEEEIMAMVAALEPYPIVMERVRGIFIQEHGFSGFAVSDDYEEIAYRWWIQQAHGIRPTLTTALYEALCERTVLLQKGADEVLQERAEWAQREQAREELIRQVRSGHKNMVVLFDGARVERVIRHKSFMFYQGQLMHIVGDFTLHGLRHRAWYTLDQGWCEIPVGVPLNQLSAQGTIGL